MQQLGGRLGMSMGLTARPEPALVLETIIPLRFLGVGAICSPGMETSLGKSRQAEEEKEKSQ